MGRVSRKRKLKQCDPFFRGKRDNGKQKKVYDLPPTESKRAKKRKRRQVNEDAIERFVIASSEVGTASGGIVLENGSNAKKRKLDGLTIRPDETMKAFNKRVNTEIKRVVYEEAKKGRRKVTKSKEFFQKKKEKQREKKMSEQERYEKEFQTQGETAKDSFQGAERVRFGERVDAPPILPVLKGIFKKRAEEKAKANAAKASAAKANAATTKRKARTAL